MRLVARSHTFLQVTQSVVNGCAVDNPVFQLLLQRPNPLQFLLLYTLQISLLCPFSRGIEVFVMQGQKAIVVRSAYRFHVGGQPAQVVGLLVAVASAHLLQVNDVT